MGKSLLVCLAILSVFYFLPSEAFAQQNCSLRTCLKPGANKPQKTPRPVFTKPPLKCLKSHEKICPIGKECFCRLVKCEAWQVPLCKGGKCSCIAQPGVPQPTQNYNCTFLGCSKPGAEPTKAPQPNPVIPTPAVATNSPTPEPVFTIPPLNCPNNYQKICKGNVCSCSATKCEEGQQILCQGGLCSCIAQPGVPQPTQNYNCTFLGCSKPGAEPATPQPNVPVIPTPYFTNNPVTPNTPLPDVNNPEVNNPSTGELSLDMSGQAIPMLSYKKYSFSQGNQEPSTGAIPVAGKWHVRNISTVGFFAPFESKGIWYLDANGDGELDPGIHFGVATDIPVVGDWNGDGIDDLGVVRGDTWYLDLDGSRSWTPPNDVEFKPFSNICGIPVVGDLTGDGREDIALFKDGYWYIRLNLGMGGVNFSPVQNAFFGAPGDFPLIVDRNGDGRQELTVKRDSLDRINSTWYADVNSSFTWNAGDLTVNNFGLAIDVPLGGKWADTLWKETYGLYRSMSGLSGVASTTCAR